MPTDAALSTQIWTRYAFCRDNGHRDYVDKADKCERFFAGDQWDPKDRMALELARRPALTINKILSTMAVVMGEQIYNRSETSFQPRNGAMQATADALTMVYKQIGDNNQLEWKRSDVFTDGIITGRGFYDVRLDYGDSLQGEVRIETLNPKNVIIDPDGEQTDPDSWNEVFITKWLTADDIAVLYSPEDAEILRHRGESSFPYGYDSIENHRDRFAGQGTPLYMGHEGESSQTLRNLRVIERQYRKLDRQKHFVFTETGDTRPVPEDFTRDKIAFFREKFGFEVITKLVKRIRWTVICDNVVLHDGWSPYQHLTVVPYFPYFRRGNTIGLVENLLGSQELLNKVSSQELHVVNTTANSGWKIKSGVLTNMTVEELEQKGAQTGLVLELSELEGAEKIAPNQVPQGLDRVSYKAEEHIKSISGVNDAQTGFVREDVAAKAIDKNKQSGQTGLAKALDSLNRSDFMLARNVLDIVQEFYTEQRLITITKNSATGEQQSVTVNEVTPEGTIANDLTLGEYGIVTTSVPARETLEDGQFEQALALRQMGVMIPDSVLVKASRLINKTEIIKLMEGDKESPEAQAAQELQRRAQEAEVAKVEGEAQAKHADAGLKQAKAQETTIKAQVLANTPIEDPNAGKGGNPELEFAEAEHEAGLKEREFERDTQLKFMEHGLKREMAQNDQALKAQDLAQKRATERATAFAQAAAAAQAPKPQPDQGTRK